MGQPGMELIIGRITQGIQPRRLQAVRAELEGATEDHQAFGDFTLYRYREENNSLPKVVKQDTPLFLLQEAR